MNKILRTLLLLVLASGCGHSNMKTPSNSVSKDDSLDLHSGISVIRQPEVGKVEIKNWTDSAIQYYVTHSDNELIKSALQSKLTESWLFDQLISSDTANYLVYQVGHDVSDAGGRNKRFVTDQWIYIDSLTKRLYEYDVEKDSLSRWQN